MTAPSPARTPATATRTTPATGSSPLRLFGWRHRADAGDSSASEGSSGRILVVGLGNPGSRYAATRHNVGFEVAAELSRRWDLPKAKQRFRGQIAEGHPRPGGPRVALLVPHTYMNESGTSAGPARGQLKVPIEEVVVIHDEIDLEFGEIKLKLGGGAAGHNGLKSLKQGFGSTDFWRVRVGVGRPDSTDPEVVSTYVLGKFAESREDVRELIADAATQTERLVEQISAEQDDPLGEVMS